MADQINVEFKAGKVWLYRNGNVSVVIPAELVEAAPAMLEALTALRKFVETWAGTKIDPLKAKADAVIAAAEPEAGA